MRTLLCIVALAGLAGCALAPTGIEEQFRTGAIDLEEVDADAGLYRVSVLNSFDLGWDGNSAQDRQLAVQYLLGERCERTEIQSDVPQPMGVYAFSSKPRIMYAMTVRCLGTLQDL